MKYFVCILIVAFISIASVFSAEKETSLLYVKASGATLRDRPVLVGPGVQVKAGEAVENLGYCDGEKKRFYKVKLAGEVAEKEPALAKKDSKEPKEGCISALFVSHDPIVSSDEVAQLGKSPEDIKSARARFRKGAATMGVRGLRSGVRSSDVGNRVPADYKSLERVERYQTADVGALKASLPPRVQ